MLFLTISGCDSSPSAEKCAAPEVLARSRAGDQEVRLHVTVAYLSYNSCTGRKSEFGASEPVAFRLMLDCRNDSLSLGRSETSDQGSFQRTFRVPKAKCTVPVAVHVVPTDSRVKLSRPLTANLSS